MAQVVEQLAQRPLSVARTGSFELERPDTELQRLAAAGTVLLLTKGFYALIPENRRGTSTTWRPTIEGAALGMAAALYSHDRVALVGPSAARAHGCYPRALATAYVAVPRQRRPRQTALGEVRFINRDIDAIDTVRVKTDLGPGYASSVEQTALDLCRDRPAWNITDEARTEMIRLLSARIDWDLIDRIAASTRSMKTLGRLRSMVGRNAP